MTYNKEQEVVSNKLEKTNYEDLYDLIYELKDVKLITEAESNMAIHAYYCLYDLFWHISFRKDSKIDLPKKLLMPT